ncbi:universal stress protein [Streptomyces sp. 549]|uniref:universal stress protein n=1 Tax=Streptomyces sp. 549 TaxID=3049076 RepID=UPI0024C25C7E|nr:universal stress protein [Streptomyces sp. 549]MDK1472236.1 universal stress protein [Streptomyces sp. 549]
MQRRGPVVVGVDGSPTALTAVDWAADRAQHDTVPLVIAHAFLWDRHQGDDRSPAERLRKRSMLVDATGRAGQRAPAVSVATELLAEPTVSGLLHAARNASLLVLGSRRRGTLASLLLGSVGSGVAAQARCPVVVMRGRVGVSYGSRPRVVLGVADRTDAGAAVFALDEAERLGGEVLAVRAGRPDAPPAEGTGAPCGEQPTPARRTATQVLAEAPRSHPGVQVEHRHVEGPAKTALLDASYGAELLVVGAEGRKGRKGIGLSSVHHAILHRAHCPVAVVPLG